MLKIVRSSLACLISLLCIGHVFAQKNTRKHYFEGEILTGSIVPNNLHYPPFGMLSGFGLTLGSIDTSESSLNQYFNFPKTGVFLGYQHLGNDSIFGSAVNVMPVIELISGKHWSFRLGLGVSYYTKTHMENPLNEAIGSHLTWGFQTMLYRYFPLKNNNYLKIGGVFLHGSNGHTQLPNYGLNVAAIAVGLQFFSQPLVLPTRNRDAFKESRTWMFTQRVGIGWHELGSTHGPVGGPKRPVYNTSVAVGILLKKHFKVQAGFGYRYYQQYASYIKTHPEVSYLNANNVYLTLGTEFFLGHVSMVVDGGINLYKPFYPYFEQEFEDTSNWSYELKRLFLSRVGLNFYLFNTSKAPKQNFYLGAQLHANFGQADFSGISLGYYRVLKTN